LHEKPVFAEPLGQYTAEIVARALEETGNSTDPGPRQFHPYLDYLHVLAQNRLFFPEKNPFKILSRLMNGQAGYPGGIKYLRVDPGCP
jgi:hypothetical protein